MNDTDNFLPVNMEAMTRRGWDCLDFLFISGDAYVDHPSFGHAVISRLLEDAGFRVGIIPQPDWNNPGSLMEMGVPRLAVLISSGVIDSMVNHYTAGKKPRSTDGYSPGGKVGGRPDRAVIVYSNKVREVMKCVPIIIGGIEASLRRFAHYDYWQDRVRASVLLDSAADLLVYGNGEKPVLEIASLLDRGVPVRKINSVRGTALIDNVENFSNSIQNAITEYREGGKADSFEAIPRMKEAVIIPSYEDVAKNKKLYAEAFMLQYKEQDPIRGKAVIQQHSNRYLVQNPPALPLSEKEMDRIYALPYERKPHPMYDKTGGVPAINEVQFSITSHRGCYGGCSFCSIAFHQGRIIQRRSKNSIICEAEHLTGMNDFKGYIHDVGGPTANFRIPSCSKQKENGTCQNRECLYPKPCKNMQCSHKEYLEILRSLRQINGIKKVFVRSGIRFDYLIADNSNEFIYELCKHHISGQLKVAPEHISNRVLNAMGKPSGQVYNRFVKKYNAINNKLGKKQYLVPYFISGHPGSTLNDAIELALYIKRMGHRPEQVQQFYPTPGTMSTCMYYTGYDPRFMKKIYVPKSEKEQRLQRALLQFSSPKNHKSVREALILAGREELIGNRRNCLVPAEPMRSDKNRGNKNKKSSAFNKRK